MKKTFWSNVPLKKEDGWYLIESNLTSGLTVSEVGPFSTESAAKAELAKLQKKKINPLDEEIAIINSSLDNSGFNIDGEEVMDAAEMEAKREEIQLELTKQESDCLADATNLLQNLAKIYLKGGIINQNEYIKTKIKLESEALSSVIFQLKTSRLAIHRLCQDISMGNYGTKGIEVLTQLQRVVLDISKFQHQYMTSIENVFKDHANSEIGENDNVGDPKMIEMTKQPGDGIVYSNRTNLIKDLNKFVQESNAKDKIPASFNKNLPVDADMIEATDNHTNKENLDINVDSGSGLDGFN
jgi:hypothetical protein